MGSGTDLTCHLCSKAFDNKRSQIRHTSYCRKKAKHPPRTRKRSCFACIKAKAHCDAFSSPCSRCLQKDINCIYEHLKRLTIPASSQGESLPSDLVEFPGRSASAEQVEAILSSQGNIPSSATVALMNSEASGAPEILTLPTAPSSMFGWPHEVPWTIPAACPLGQHLIPRGTRAFSPKGLRPRQLSLVRKFVLNTILAYPRKSLLESDLPPFISPIWMVEERRAAENAQPGPLSRCTAIMSLWLTKQKNNAHYLWRIMRNEQSRLFEESVSNNDWDAVAALQAITIYFLLRASAEDDEDVDFDIPLIQTMTTLSQRVRGLTMKYCDPTLRTCPTWEDWVLVESLRRTITALFIIEFLFDLSPGMGNVDCNSAKHWSEMLLPSAKQLWAAKTRSRWERVYQELKNDRRPTFGELLRHNRFDSRHDDDLLETWMGQVDEFGALVINAAVLAMS